MWRAARVGAAAGVPACTPAPPKSVRCRAPLPAFLMRSPWPGPAGTPSLRPSRAVNSRRGRTPCTLSGEPVCGLLPPELRNVPSSPSSSLYSHDVFPFERAAFPLTTRPDAARDPGMRLCLPTGAARKPLFTGVLKRQPLPSAASVGVHGFPLPTAPPGPMRLGCGWPWPPRE